MRRILAIFKRDMKSNFREFLLIYIIVAPLLLAIGLRFFIPNVNTTGLTFAIDAKVSSEVISEFKKYGKVELCDSLDQLEERVKKIDDVTALTVKDQSEYQIIVEGNEKNNIIRTILESMELEKDDVPLVEFSDIGYKLSPLTSIGSVSIILMAIVLSGMVIGLSIIEDKELDILSALNVTPLTRGEYIFGKSLVGFLLALFLPLLILWIIGLTDINYLMVLVIALISSLVSMIYGFLIGVSSPNQMAGIAMLKILLLPVSASVIGAILLPENLQFLLYWSPIYWAYKGLYNTVLDISTWNMVGVYSLWIIGLTLIVFIIFKHKIREGIA